MSLESRPTVVVEILYFTGCSNAGPTLALVRRCVERLAADVTLLEREGDYASPTVRVNGRDVMGAEQPHGRACRRDIPTEARVMDALRAALGGGSP